MPATKRKTNSRLAAMLSGLTGFPAESFGDMPVLLCRGSMEILVEGCRSILEYGETKIRLDMGDRTTAIEGENLSMSDFHRNCLTVRGKITAVRWEGGPHA